MENNNIENFEINGMTPRGFLVKFRQKLPKIEYKKMVKYVSQAFEGDGFYVNRKNIRYTINCNVFDMNWAYGAALLNNKYPKSAQTRVNQIDFKKTYKNKYKDDGKLGIYEIEVDDYTKKYRFDFDYTLYEKKIKQKHFLLTNIDFYIFNQMYEWSGTIYTKLYFDDVDQIDKDLQETIKEIYKKKNELKSANSPIYEEFKKKIEIICYGKQAQCKRANNGAIIDDVRDSHILIPIFQNAYVRLKEFKIFIKNINSVIYMNTDSVAMLGELDSKIVDDVKLGKFKKEFRHCGFLFIDRMQYVIIEHNVNERYILKQAISGVIEKITIEKCKILVNTDKSVFLETLNSNKEKYAREIKCKYRNDVGVKL